MVVWMHNMLKDWHGQTIVSSFSQQTSKYLLLGYIYFCNNSHGKMFALFCWRKLVDSNGLWVCALGLLERLAYSGLGLNKFVQCNGPKLMFWCLLGHLLLSPRVQHLENVEKCGELYLRREAYLGWFVPRPRLLLQPCKPQEMCVFRWSTCVWSE